MKYLLSLPPETLFLTNQQTLILLPKWKGISDPMILVVLSKHPVYHVIADQIHNLLDGTNPIY